MDTNDNKFDVQAENLQIRQGRFLVSSRWFCSRFGIPSNIFYDCIEQLRNTPFLENNIPWINEDDFGSLMHTRVGSYFTTAQAEAVASLLQGKRGRGMTTTQPALKLQRKRGEEVDLFYPISHLQAVYAEDKYVMAQTRSGVRFVDDSHSVSIKKLEQGILKGWLRVNRGILINPAYLKGLGRDAGRLMVRLHDVEYPVSRRNHSRVRQCLRDWGGEL